MPITETDDEKDEKLVAVESDAAEGGEVVALDAAPVSDKKLTDKSVEDERVAAKDESEPSDTPADETHEQKRERESQKERRERQRRAMERDKRELNFLRQRNEDLEKRQSQVEMRVMRGEYSTLDAAISQVDEGLRSADGVIAAAIEANAGKDVVEAQNIRSGLIERRRQLEYQKQRVAEQARQQAAQEQRPAQAQSPQVDPEAAYFARGWIEKNAWFKPDRSDDDSAIAAVIDERLSAEGFDPSTPEYWSELDSRLRERLPHRYKKPNGNGQQGTEQRDDRRDAPPRTPVANRQPALKPGEFYVSPDRKQAMMDAGIWDDELLRKKTLKRYAEYDKLARESNGR